VVDKEAKMAEEAAMSQEDIIAEGKAYEAAYTGDINSGAVLLGQSIGTIKSLESVEKIVEEIVQDAENRLKNAYSFIK
jgi:NAD(P)H-dependent flavin oxidoreductase YrpB (nitropropane dioxygenase family)